MNPGCAHFAAQCKIKPERQDWLCPDRVTFFLAEVTTARLNVLSELFDASKLQPQVGSVRPLTEAKQSHEMLAGDPHARGKTVLPL